MSASELRVFIADDEAPARARLKELLADVRSEIATSVAGEAANGLEVIERLPASGAQVLLLDIQMPGMAGIEVARHLGRLPAFAGTGQRDPRACSRVKPIGKFRKITVTPLQKGQNL